MTFDDGLLSRRRRTSGSPSSTSRARSRAIRPAVRTAQAVLGEPHSAAGCRPSDRRAVCEVEVDPDTGAVEVTRYAAVDDVGQPINPLVLHGQVHGGIIQGFGQALREGVVRDGPARCSPRASWTTRCRAPKLPPFDWRSPRTDQRQCTAREGRRRGRHHARLAATMNAVVDALPQTASNNSRCRRRRRVCGRLFGHDGRSLDLDLRGLLDQPADLHHRHRGKIRAERLAIGAAEVLAGSRDTRPDR